MTRPEMQQPLSLTITLAMEALFLQGEHGVISRLARTHEISRREVYSLRERAKGALAAEFHEHAPKPPSTFTLTVTEADIARTAIALRVVTPASIRDEVAMLPIIYGTGWSFGKIQALLVEAGERAAALDARVDLSPVVCAALDEMFSQGQPVLAGIDIDTQYLFHLEAHTTRSGEAWATSLGRLRDKQGLHPQFVVKDAGTGLGKGVDDAFPDAQQNDDLFHAKQAMNKVAARLERSAYAAIAQLDALEHMRAKNLDGDESLRRSLGQRIFHARKRETMAIERYDRFDALQREAEKVLELADRGSGRLRTSAEVVEVLTDVTGHMMTIGGKHVRGVARYIRNRAQGLGRYLNDLALRLNEVTEEAGGQVVTEATVRVYQASLLCVRGGPRWDARARDQELRLATRDLFEVTERRPEALWTAVSKVFPVLARRHRASSAIENLNSVLRPYLVVQKSTSQPFLELFKFYWNNRIREWGPHKHTSAHEMLTGERVDDWLTRLGYPPGDVLAAAA